MTTDVAERAEAVTADPGAPEPQTEDALQLELEPAAAAPEEPAAAPEEPDRVAELAAEVARLREQQEAQERKSQQAQRQRQRQNALAAQQRQREQADESEAAELLSAQLTRLGLDPETGNAATKPILDRFAQKRFEQVASGVLSDIGDAFSATAADMLGLEHEISLSERGEGYAARFEPFLKDFSERATASAMEKLRAEGWKSPEDVVKAIEAGVAAKLNGQQQGKQPLRQPEGQPATARDDTPKAIVERVIAGVADEKDLEAYRNGDVKARFRRGEN